MNRDEFLLKLFSMYPNAFTENNIGTWKEAYEQVLKLDWDYKKLFHKMVTSYQYTNTAPAPAYFYEFRKDVKPEIKAVKDEETKGEPPTQRFLEAKKKLKQSTNAKSNLMVVGE